MEKLLSYKEGSSIFFLQILEMPLTRKKPKIFVEITKNFFILFNFF